VDPADAIKEQLESDNTERVRCPSLVR
jgi:hypothetical protein